MRTDGRCDGVWRRYHHRGSRQWRNLLQISVSIAFGCLSLVGNKELTRCAAIVEDYNGPRLPPHSRLKVVPSDDMLHEEVQQPALLGLLQTLNLGDELAVHKKTFLACDWVDAHKRVDGVDGFFAYQAPSHTCMLDHFCR